VKIKIETQQAADRIINKTGRLVNPADRDHCLQYMVAVALIKGNLTAEDYEAGVASDPAIDTLRGAMEVIENERFSTEYLEPDKRAIGNAIQVFFKDGSATDRVSIDYPVGHPRRRNEGIPLLKEKFERHLHGAVIWENAEQLLEICSEQARFEQATVDEIMSLLSL
jgi:2-methylcitrate dehydratase PrpD